MKKSGGLFNCSMFILLLMLIISICALPVSASAASSYTIGATSYQSKIDSSHSTQSSKKVNTFAFGSRGIGQLSISGSMAKEKLINGIEAYSSDRPIEIGYKYDGAFLDDGKDRAWFLESDAGKTLSNFSLLKKIGKGALVIQKSSNGTHWDNVAEPITDFFTNKKIDRSKLYTVSRDELKAGTYFRVFLAYEMKHKTGTKEGWLIFPDTNIYEDYYFTEVYQFYCCYGADPIVFRDIDLGKQTREIKSGETAQYGFIIDKKGSSNRVEIRKDHESWKTVNTLTTVVEPGTYSIKTTTPLGKEYSYSISITDGLNTSKIKPTVYENKKKDGYTENNPIHGNTTFEVSSHTSLMIAQKSELPIVTSKISGFDAYGINLGKDIDANNNSVLLYLRLQSTDIMNSKNWHIVSDEWGKKSSQTIGGVQTGQIDSGALIIQTSLDGRNWKNENAARYTTGLYGTTDFENHYGDKGDVIIYTPAGKDILRGIYVRILYAFEVANESVKEDLRCLEKYEFYLCSDYLDAVTFHNLSIDKKADEIFGEYDENTTEIYHSAETLVGGDYTVTGFSIDTKLNPTVKFSVEKNGEPVKIPANREFTETGKYDIELKSAVGSTKKIALYVDRMTTDEALQFYFGEPVFLSGKRIYSDGAYPVYEGGHVQYTLLAVDGNHLPLGGYILNSKTKEKTEITASRVSKSDVINDPGHYIAVFAPRDENFSSGDRKVFTFQFDVIEEGTAPGPKLNQESFKRYASETISDSYPLYYALYFQGYPKGRITLAFENEQDAYDYAYQYESGTVEVLNDGTYVYGESYIINEKEEYDGWTLADRLDHSAKNAVKRGYFDLSNEIKVRTINPDLLRSYDDQENKENEDIEGTFVDDVRELKLDKSVVLFALGQKEKLTSKNQPPYIISDKPYYYLEPGPEGTVKQGKTFFKFVQDKDKNGNVLGLDSYTVAITDKNGITYDPIIYGKSVGQQLTDQHCPSGEITITEKTKYGDEKSYNAVYIADGENTAIVTISGYQDGKVAEITVDQKNDGSTIQLDAINNISIQDELDPYSLVIITHNGKEQVYAMDQCSDLSIQEYGLHTVKIANRLGASYKFTMDITNPNFAAISFEGDGTEGVQNIPTEFGEQHVQLPRLEMEGYNLVGFKDDEGKLYSTEIEEITFKGAHVLHAVWDAKQFLATFQAADGKTISTLTVDYGKEFELPVPDVPEGKKFNGWMLDGNLLDSKSYTLQDEKNITFIAKVSNTNLISRMADSLTQNRSILIIALTIIMIILILIAIAQRRNRNDRRRARH